MSSASVSIIRTYAHHGWRIVSGLGLGSVILLWAVSASAQMPGTSTSQTCTQDPTRIAGTPVHRRARRRARAAVRLAAVRAEEPARRRRSPTPHAATVSPWMPGVTATEWQSDTCAVRDRPAHPLALPQLVAIDDRARNARHVIEDAALDPLA